MKPKPNPGMINVTHTFPPYPAAEGFFEATKVLSAAVQANATALEQNAIALQKIASAIANGGVSTQSKPQPSPQKTELPVTFMA